MRQKPTGRPSSSEKIIRDIKRKTRKQYSAEEKIRIVLDGLRGEDSTQCNVGYHSENDRLFHVYSCNFLMLLMIYMGLGNER